MNDPKSQPTEPGEGYIDHSLARRFSYKVGGGCVLTLCPPMTISRSQLDAALDIVEDGIQTLG